MRITVSWLLFLGLLFQSCGGDGNSGDPSATDSNESSLDGASSTQDGVASDVSSDSVGTGAYDTESSEKQVASVIDPIPLDITSWRVAVISGNDPLYTQLDYGTFKYPELGLDENGVVWQDVDVDESGGLGTFGNALVYATAVITVEEDTGVVAKLNHVYTLFAGGARQPGDIYGAGKVRVPLNLQAGENLLVARAFGGRGNIHIGLWSTPDEVTFNFADYPPPDLVVGQARSFPLGVPVLNLAGNTILGLKATVVENETFSESSETFPALAQGAVTQIPFTLTPKQAFETANETVVALLRLEAPSLEWVYEREIEFTTVAAGEAYRRTFRSPVDASVQYYGVLPPADFDEAKEYALVLSLHGAAVEAINQATSYSKKDWTYIVAPTNRRPYGFDWEEWGHLNARSSLNDAQSAFNIDPTRVYLTGHSMGGHGTWHVGVMNPTRFAAIAPSAGWNSFYTYGGSPKPSWPFDRARAHSDTTHFLTNLARRGVYILHGTADDNVPISEGRAMHAAILEVTSDVGYHEEPGAGHWWDGDVADGADCVDWPPIFEFFQAHTLDPFELEFDFISPGPWYSAHHSYATIRSAASARLDCRLTSTSTDGVLTLNTDNIHSLEIDSSALTKQGVETITVDGNDYELSDTPLIIGPTEGKRLDAHGPYNQVFQKPFGFVYPDGSSEYANYASYLISQWNIIGNGHAFALPRSALDDAIYENYNLIHLGAMAPDIGDPEVPFQWSAGGISFNDTTYSAISMLFLFPAYDRVSALIYTPPGMTHLLYSVVPFSSRSGMPDYLLWYESGLLGAGFFNTDWIYDPAQGILP